MWQTKYISHIQQCKQDLMAKKYKQKTEFSTYFFFPSKACVKTSNLPNVQGDS